MFQTFVCCEYNNLFSVSFYYIYNKIYKTIIMAKFGLLAFFIFVCSFALRANDVDEITRLYNKAKDELYTFPLQSINSLGQVLLALPDSEKKAEVLFYYASAERLLGDYDGSSRTLFEASMILKKFKNEGILQDIYDLSSLNYCIMNDYNKAIEFSNKAMELAKISNDSARLAQNYNNRGIIYVFMKQYEQADHFLELALQINRNNRNLKSIAANLNNLCLYKGDIDQKIAWINEAIVINKNLKANWSLAENYNNKGLQYYYDGQYAKSMEELEQARGIAEYIGAKGLIIDNYEYKAMVYAAMKDYKMAYEAQMKMYELKNELQSENKLKSLELQLAHEQIRMVSRENEQKQQEYEIRLLNRNMFIIIISFVFLLFIVFLFFIRARRKKKSELFKANYKLKQSEVELARYKMEQQEKELKKIQEDLDNNRKEITNFAVFLQSRNELLEKIIEELKKAYKMNSQELVSHLKTITAFIKQYQANDKVVSTIMQEIDSQNSAFIGKLIEKHPDLTPGERHLATLLRVDLSTKEIAMLTGTTAKTVNMNRYRLRKSLDLPSDTDLVSYLQSI